MNTGTGWWCQEWHNVFESMGEQTNSPNQKYDGLNIRIRGPAPRHLGEPPIHTFEPNRWAKAASRGQPHGVSNGVDPVRVVAVLGSGHVKKLGHLTGAYRSPYAMVNLTDKPDRRSFAFNRGETSPHPKQRHSETAAKTTTARRLAHRRRRGRHGAAPQHRVGTVEDPSERGAI